MKFDFIYFDSGGTIYGIFEGEDPTPKELNELALIRVENLLNSFGYKYAISNEEEALWKATDHCQSYFGAMKYTYKEVLEKFFKLLNIDLPVEIITCLSDVYAGPRYSSWIFPGTLQAFKELTNAGVELGIIANTTWSSYNMDRAFEGVGLLPYLKHRVYSGNVGYAKPEMEIFQFAENLASIKGKRVLYVGNDIEKDVVASKRFGWSTAFRTSEKMPSSCGKSDFDFNDIKDLVEFCR
ncbi:MAG: hypothetical protein COA79_11195 [Planctomycetota bacterium]|nr:MAG: hypothetical protein COA79_11195 [Planctomycetota bacterium]